VAELDNHSDETLRWRYKNATPVAHVKLFPSGAKAFAPSLRAYGVVGDTAAVDMQSQRAAEEVSLDQFSSICLVFRY